MKTFRRNTILNADDVAITSDNSKIRVTRVETRYIKNKGKHVGYKTVESSKYYPNTLVNRKKAEKEIGKLTREDSSLGNGRFVNSIRNKKNVY